MKKTDLTRFLKGVKTSAVKHSPEILTSIGIAGMVTTAVLAVKATPKALQLIDAEKRNRGSENYDEELKEWCGDPMTVIDTVKVAWKPYIPAVTLGVLSTVCLISANSVSTRRTAVIATAYKISETAFTEYKDKVVEVVGEKKEQLIKDKVAEEKVKKNPLNESQVIVVSNGQTLCLDALSGQYFRSDIEKIRRVESDLNKRMINDMYVSLNEVYDSLGLRVTTLGRDLGWNLDSDGLLEFHFSSQLAENGEPCLVLDYRVQPRYEYSKFVY